MNKPINYLPGEGDIEVVIDLTNEVPIDFVDQHTLIVKATSEGVIMDFYQDGEPAGTIARTYSEWCDSSQ